MALVKQFEKISDSTRRENRGFYIFTIIIVSFFLVGFIRSIVCQKERTWKEAGVVLTGKYDREGLLENTNNYPVQIRCVSQGSGERTLWIRVMQPNQKLRVMIRTHIAYYIVTVDGVEIGIIKLGI